MLDDSILQLLEASRTVPIYTRKAGEQATAVNPGHYACDPTCAVPMSTDNTYWTTVFNAVAHDGCEAQAGIVWAQQDRAWRDVMRGSLAYSLYRTRGLTETYNEEILTNNEWLDSELYVRLVIDDEVDEVVHRNQRVTLRNLFVGFSEEHQSFQRVKSVTYGMRATYFDPTIPFDTLQQATVGTDRELLPFIRTWDQRYLPRALRHGAVKLVRMDAGAVETEPAAQERPLVTAGAEMRATANARIFEAMQRNGPPAYVTENTTVGETQWRRPGARPPLEWLNTTDYAPDEDELMDIEMEDL